MNRRAFSLIECTVSVMLVGILMTAALRSLSTSHYRTAETLLQMQGRQLCDAFSCEIGSKSFAEPSNPGASLGVDATENPMSRASLDDVDDYSNMNLTPPTDQLGNVIAGLSNWRIAVAVGWADPTSLAATASTNTHLKRIEVQAFFAERLISSTVIYRAADEY